MAPDSALDDGDPFSLPHWRPSPLLSQPPSGLLFPLPGLVDLSVHAVQEKPREEPVEEAWKVPDLDAPESLAPVQSLVDLFNLTPAPVTTPGFPPLSSNATTASYEDDGFLFDPSLNDAEPEQCGRRLTWEAFYAEQKNATSAPAEFPLYLSESSPAVMDAALAERMSRNGRSNKASIVQTAPFVRSLLQLGLGRSSTLFPLSNGRFTHAIQGATVTGHSWESCSALVQYFFEIGTAVVDLRQFTADASALPSYQSVAVSLARAVDEVLGVVEQHVMRHERGLNSVLGLHDIFTKPREVVLALRDLAEKIVRSPDRYKASVWLDTTLKHAHLFEDEQPHMRHLFRYLLDRVATPVLEDAEAGLGVGRRANLGAHLVDSLNQSMHRQDALTGLFSAQDQRRYEQTALYAEFLTRDQPEHPAICPREYAIATPEIRLCFDWQDVERAENKARSFERQLIDAIAEYTGSRPSHSGSSRKTGNVPPQMPSRPVNSTGWDLDGSNLDESIRAIQNFDSHSSAALSSSHHLSTHLFQEPSVAPVPPLFSPSISLVPSLTMTSILASQHRILSYLTLHSILHRHALQPHLDAHHAFSLFQSGSFAHRLGTVLFSSSLQSAERQTGTLRTGGALGLQLGTGQRRAWPPASSEIRLALLGVLDESWRDDHASREAHLPAGLSFSIRNVPEDAIPGILNPHSIHALDFLKLAYAPPAALTAVFTSECLDNYDTIFMHLLRLLRIRFLVLTQIPLDLRLLARRGAPGDKGTEALRQLQNIAVHVVSNLVEHSMLYGIQAPWALFRAHVAQMAEDVASPVPPANDDGASRRAAGKTLAELAVAHEVATTSIAGNLLLHRRQSKVSHALDVFLGDVISLGRVLREWTLPGEEREEEEAAAPSTTTTTEQDAPPTFEVDDAEARGERAPLRLESRFKQHLGAFLHECQKLAVKADTGQVRAGDEGAHSAALLLQRLNGANDWAAKFVGG